MKRTTLVTILVLLLTACGNGDDDPTSAQPKTATVAGLVDLLDITAATRMPLGEPVRAGMSCSGNGSHSDLTTGAQVLVLDEAGATIGKGQLEAGSFQPARGAGCTWPYAVHGVPTTKAFYRLTVASRGGPTFSAEELSSTGWKMDLAIE
jgi:hypothetical protein